MERVLFAFSLFSAIAIVLIAIGITLWILIRQKRQRLWLPILRIMEQESRLLPKMQFITPPWLAFLLFLLCAGVFALFTLEPRLKVYSPFEPNQTHIHVYLDMSPSVAIETTIEETISKIQTLIQSLEGNGRVSVSTSHSKEVFEASDWEPLMLKLKAQGFHRQGLKLGESLVKHLESLGDINVLLIVSDGDQATWEGFNWGYLEEDMEVKFVELKREHRVNVFFEDIAPTSKAGSDLVEWDVRLSRSGDAGAVQGNLKVTYNEQEVFTGGWTIPEDRDSVELSVRWPSSRLEMIDANQHAPLVWTLQTENSTQKDHDDEFRTYPTGLKRSILLVSDHKGENFLEDPAHHLRIALEIQGFRVNRVDRFSPQLGSELSNLPVWIVLAGNDRSVDLQCPVDIPTPETSDISIRSSQQGPTLKWLAPHSPSANWRIMCRCFSRFAGLEVASEPEFCKEVQTRDQFVSVLRSVGAKQVGGVLGDDTSSLAWQFKNIKTDKDLLTFTLPLKPDLSTGLNYSSLPLVVKTLVGWQGISIKSELDKTTWPRIQSIASQIYTDDVPDTRISNVPLGESTMKEFPPESLPPIWDPKANAKQKPLSGKKDAENPLPLLKIFLMIVMAAMAIEGIVGCLRLVFQSSKSNKIASILLAMLGAAVIGMDQPARAMISLHLVGSPNSDVRTSILAREIAARTSINFSETAVVSKSYTKEALLQPWMWVDGSKALQSDNGILDADTVSWIKRGGFLVIENAEPLSKLSNLTATNEFLLNASDGWSEIPPDHELMRSFHLLDALPPCNGQMWYGFKMDGRLAILAIPGGFVGRLADTKTQSGCHINLDQEKLVRTFINVLMVALATDYKNDQIHLPEILKRLR